VFRPVSAALARPAAARAARSRSQLRTGHLPGEIMTPHSCHRSEDPSTAASDEMQVADNLGEVAVDVRRLGRGSSRSGTPEALKPVANTGSRSGTPGKMGDGVPTLEGLQGPGILRTAFGVRIHLHAFPPGRRVRANPGLPASTPPALGQYFWSLGTGDWDLL
jgi:hypothetical protein